MRRSRLVGGRCRFHDEARRKSDTIADLALPLVFARRSGRADQSRKHCRAFRSKVSSRVAQVNEFIVVQSRVLRLTNRQVWYHIILLDMDMDEDQSVGVWCDTKEKIISTFWSQQTRFWVDGRFVFEESCFVVENGIFHLIKYNETRGLSALIHLLAKEESPRVNIDTVSPPSSACLF